MERPATVGTKLFAVFTALVVAIVTVALTSLIAVGLVGSEEENATSHAARLVGISHLVTQTEQMAAASRKYLRGGGAESLDGMRRADASFEHRVAELRNQLPAREAAHFIDDIESAEHAYVRALAKIGDRRATTPVPAEIDHLRRKLRAARGELLARVALLRKYEERQSELAERLATRDTRRALAIVLVVAIAALGASTGLAVVLARVLRALEQRQHERDAYLSQLQAANGDLDAFAGRIAHDLRNVVAPVSAWCAALKRVHSDPDTVDHIVDRLEAHAKKTVTLLEGLLAFSRAGGPPDLTASASVAEVVADVLHELRDLATEADATIERHVTNVRVACAPALLHLVIANLVQNALKFLRGRDTRRVRIATTALIDKHCAIIVEDTGPGIPPDKIGSIFEPFYRVPGTATAGTGIGLATVRRIVDAHGGRVGVDSRPGAGSRFTFELPIADVRTVAMSGNGHAPGVATAP